MDEAKLTLGKITGRYRTAVLAYKKRIGETTNRATIKALIRQTPEYKKLEKQDRIGS